MKELIQIISAFCTGFYTTMIHVFRGHATEQYPEYKRPLPKRSRAVIILTCDPDGRERCVACYLCSAMCPVDCISMQAAEDPEGRRYAAWFRINFGRCIYCGLCEEACPTSAIQLTPVFENSDPDIMKLVYEKKDLQVAHCGKDENYNFYEYAGVATKLRGKGSHANEEPPVNTRTNMP